MTAGRRPAGGKALPKAAIPRDFAKALRSREKTRENFDRFPASVKRGILAWIESAKRPETREHRVEETARLASWNVQINQWRW